MFINVNIHIAHKIIITCQFTSIAVTFINITFTSLHFTTLHSPFFTSLHFWTFRHHASNTLHFSSLITTFLTLLLKICNFQRKVASASAGSWFHSLIILFTKEYLPMHVLSFPGPAFMIVNVPTQVAWSFQPVSYRFPSPFSVECVEQDANASYFTVYTMCACVRACARACVCVCVRACARACVCVYNPSKTPSSFNLNSMQIVDKFRSQYILATKAVSRLAFQTSTLL
jgi:hypothetical protein